MKKKKILACLLATLLLTSVLSACGGSPGISSESNQSESSLESSSDVADSSDDEAASTDTDTGSSMEDVPEFHIIAKLNTATEDLNDIPFYQQLSEDAGVNITYECVSSGWNDKKAALLASNDLPDAFIGYAVLTNSDVTNNTSLFANLEDLITEENTPNLKAFLDSHDYYRKAVTELDGGIYFLTDEALFRPTTFTSLMMNTEWLKAVNMDAPTTVDELEAVLTAFKEQDPNGNGEADEIPAYVAASSILKGAYGVQASIAYGELGAKDGQLVFLPTTDNWKEYVKKSHEFCEKGLFSEEALTATWDQQSARMGTDIPTVGYAELWIKDPINVDYQDQYDAILPVKGPAGDQYIAGDHQYATCDGLPKFAMSADCENKEALMRWVDSLFEPINSAQLSRGPIGVTLEEGENGKLVFIDPPEGMDWDTWNYKYAMREAIPNAGGEAVESLFEGPDPATALKLEIDEKYVDYVDYDYNVPVLKLTAEESEELSLIWPDISSYVNTSFADWFINGGVDEAWDDYCAEFDKMGISRALEIYQAAYDRMK